MSRCVIILLMLATVPCTDQLHTPNAHALSKGLIQRGSNIDMIQYRRAAVTDDGKNNNGNAWRHLTFVAAQTTDAELPAPSTPELTFISISSVNLSWSFDFSAVNPAQNVCFVIEYQNNTGYANVSSPICEGNHTFYIFSRLLRDQRYRFRVYATDGVMTTVGDWTFWFINGVEELPAPSTPEMTFISIGSVNLSWSFDFSAVDPARNVCFVIEYQNNTRYANVSSPICEGNHTFYIFSWLLRGQRYRFRVYATDGVMTTVSSWTFMFINGIEAPPGPPQNFRARVWSDTMISLSWEPSVLLSDISAAYDICFNARTRECVGSPTIFVFGETHRDVVALQPATTYYFEIRASLGPFLSVWSDWISATTYSSTLPVVSLNKNSMTVLSTSVYVQWEPIQKETLEFPFHEYYVYIGMNANDVKVNVEHHMYNYSTINNWFNITGLRPHTNYYIAVSYSVNNTVGNLVLSDGSDIVEITTQYLPPAVQCTVCKGLSKDTVQISWQITSDEDQITKSYVIFNKTDSGEYQRVAGVDNVTSTVYNITGLHPNRGYAFYVQPIADTVNGTKAECPETSCRTKQSVPDPPRNVKITSLNSTSVLVTWDDPIDNKGVISDYTVHYFCANTSQCKNDEQHKADERSLVVTGLHPFTRYTFVVFAWTIAGKGGNSKPATVRTPEAAPNGVPQLFTNFQSFPTSLSLQWSPPLLEHQNGLIIGYQVSWRLSQKGGLPPSTDTLLGITNVTSTTYTVVDLETDTFYEVNVAAFTAAGIGPSTSITAKTTDSDYNLKFSVTSVQSTTSKNCKDIKLQWNSLANKDFSYIVLISNYSFEEDENITSDWNYTTQNNFIIITRSRLVVGVVYEAVLEVVVDNSDSPLPEVVTTEVLNISLPACSNPNADDLAFSSTLVQSTTSKNCKDIELHWNLLGDGDFSYIILIHSVESLTSKWNDTTQNNSVIIPRSQLVVGRTYVAELQVVVEYNISSAPEVVVAQQLNITLPACSKPLDPVLLWSCVGGGAALVVLVLFGVCCAIYCHRRHKYKLLQQVRRPVGGANSSETLKEEEEVTLLGQATDWGSSSSISSNSSGNHDSDVPMLQVEELDTPSDEISNFGDMSLIERPLPVGAEDS